MGCMLSNLAAKFAFFPPTPPTYELKEHENGKLVAVSSSVPIENNGSLDVLLLNTKRGNKIVSFFLKNPYARLTVLYSHGNAADLGQLYDLFVQLKVNLRVNLMGYDYSGYGASSGKPSEYNTYADIEAVYECLQTRYGIGQENLILYGQSVGSGPTLHLAAKLPRLRGVVLHSAILSGLRVVCHSDFTLCCDIYKNVNKIKKVKCPILVIHGTEDDVVSWLHGNGLWKKAREPYEPLWIKGGGHCNLELYPDYIRHLCKFVHEMESMTTQIRLKKIWKNLQLLKRSSRKCCRLKICGLPECSCGLTPKRIKCLWQPKYPRCLWPKCIKSCTWPVKCFGCLKPKCPGCLRPKCPECLRPKCPECLKPKCQGCLRPQCPECLRPNCAGCLSSKCLECPRCLRLPKCINCFHWRCCTRRKHGSLEGKQGG